MTWVPNDDPPHRLATSTVPEIRNAAEKAVTAHIKMCPECREWIERHQDPDWRRWLMDSWF